MIDIQAIPAQRLALLDNAVLFHGSHDGTGGPDCRHCARELLHEVVTGKHCDASPPGASMFLNILPGLNDGPWRDDAHRTRVMRPYLRKMLLLDPAKDEQRLYPVIDHVYRKVMPEICDALKLDTHSSALRDLAKIIDRDGTRKATNVFVAAAEAARDLNLASDLKFARALDLALDRAINLDRAPNLARALAINLVLALAHARAINLVRADLWERSVTALLDVVCSCGES